LGVRHGWGGQDWVSDTAGVGAAVGRVGVHSGETIFLSEFGNETYYINALRLPVGPNCVVILVETF